MRKVLVIGSGGAGKSTFARRLAEKTGLPLIHLDMLYWHRGWVPTGHAEWDAVIDSLTRRDAWIMDGNYGRTMAVRLAACDTVIFLDVPRWRCLWRIVKRRLQHVFRPRDDMPEGCPGRLTWEFFVWVWEYQRRRRPEILHRLDAMKNEKRVTILRDDAAVTQFLVGLPA